MTNPTPRIGPLGETADDVVPFRRTRLYTDHELTIILPAHNEEERLPGTLRALCAFMDRTSVDYRVLVVDDGSSDGTALCGEGVHGRISTLRQPQQRGKGAAVRAGMLHAAGRVLSFTDADLPFDLTALLQGYELIRRGDCDVVYGARNVAGAACHARRRFLRTIASTVFREIVRLLISPDVPDTQCGLKLFRREAAREIFSRATVDGFAFDAEVVLLSRRLRLPFQRVPVTLLNEYASSLSLFRHALPMLADVFRVRTRDWRGRYDWSQGEGGDGQSDHRWAAA
jgi:dolichyl-phosphate beta-glucosyltransferase